MRHRDCNRFVLASVAVLAAYACAPAAPPPAPPVVVAARPASAGPVEALPTATVWPMYAQFEFPLPRQSVWRWRQRATPPAAREYAWLIAVPDSAGHPQLMDSLSAGTLAMDSSTYEALGEPVRFEFGFSLFQQAAITHAEGEGSLQDLVLAGQTDLWERTADGARRVARVGVLAVPRYLPSGDVAALTIQLKDPVVVAQLFASRPAEVIAIEQMPGEPARARRIAVRYAEPGGR